MYFVDFLLMLSILSFNLATSLTKPCDFNALECDCGMMDNPNVIMNAECKSSTSALPSFSATNFTFWDGLSLTITSEGVFDIPAHYFNIFGTINALTLVRSAPGLASQKWDDAAFEGTNIAQLWVRGLADVIPPPIALRRLNASLTALIITDARMPMHLNDNCLEGLSRLLRLTIDKTPIEKISNKAFDKLGSKLQRLELIEASLSAFPVEVINNMTNLDQINFSNNPIEYLPVERLTRPNQAQLQVLLKNTSLTSVDLSWFHEDHNPNFYIDLQDNALLKNVTGPAAHWTPAVGINIRHTGLERLDPKLGDFLNESRKEIIISYNDHLLCDDVSWMSYYVFCTDQLKIDSTKCADKGGQLLDQYLKTTAPVACPTSTTSYTDRSSTILSTTTTYVTPNPTTSVVASTTPTGRPPTNLTSTTANITQNSTISLTASTMQNPTISSAIVTTSTHHPTRPCPFNLQNCVCSNNNSPDPLIFFNVDCASTALALPNFTAPTNTTEKYTITGTLTIMGNVSSIPIRHFIAFKSIVTLSLIQTKTPFPTFQKWDELAFDVVKIHSFRITELEGVLPPPPALRRLGGRGLKTLVIAEGTVPIYLDDNSFDAFPSLTSLALVNTNVVQISDQAFGGIEDSVDALIIRGSSLTEFPSTAVSALSNLQSLGFEDSTISDIPGKAFLPFPSLSSLSLSGNFQLGAAIINEGALDQVSSKLTHLWLNKTGLTRVPQDFNKNQSLLQFADLSSNTIETITQESFEYCSTLAQLHLQDNPISVIENGAFLHLESASIIDLSNTKLMSIDLSVFSNVQADADLILNDNRLLKSVTASAINQIPSKARVSIINSGLEVIDCKIADLLKQNPSVPIEISNNVQLLCNVHAWMANATCPGQLKINNARCADKSGQLLSDYLKSIMPSTTCVT